MRTIAVAAAAAAAVTVVYAAPHRKPSTRLHTSRLSPLLNGTTSETTYAICFYSLYLSESAELCSFINIFVAGLPKRNDSDYLSDLNGHNKSGKVIKEMMIVLILGTSI